MITLIEIRTMPDGSLGLGNSLEVTEAEARKLIAAKKAKAVDAPIGVIPESLAVELTVDAEEEGEERKSWQRSAKGK